MARIVYIGVDGQRFEIDAENGSTVMENAVTAGIPGIEAECGGSCTCATCHVYVDERFSVVASGRESMEEQMLDMAYDVRPNSRLSCQLRVCDEFDGLVVAIPNRQR